MLKPQPLLDYNTGGVSGLGFQRCIGVRYKHYKWLSDASKTRGHGHSHMIGSRRAVPTALYRFQNNSHVELPCHEVGRQPSALQAAAASAGSSQSCPMLQVTAAEPAMAARLEAMAEAWFADMLASAHSFDRPTFFLGIDGKPQANIVADAAMQRTPGRVVVVPMGVMGFEQPGDSSWYRVKVRMPGRHVQCALCSSKRDADELTSGCAHLHRLRLAAHTMCPSHRWPSRPPHSASGWGGTATSRRAVRSTLTCKFRCGLLHAYMRAWLLAPWCLASQHSR